MRLPILLPVLALAALSAVARPLTPDEALAAAIADGRQRLAGDPVTLVYISQTSAATAPDLYVFNRTGGGFMLIAADTDVPQIVLGYSDTGEFDPTDIPAGLEAMMTLYGSQIDSQRLSSGLHAMAPRPSRPAIAPLMSTLWDQGKPYNNMCPKEGTRRSVTGCTATAMAQVMKYHEWPKDYASGAITYVSNGKELSMDFSTVKFDWDNMLDSYTGDYTDTEADAVALLMKACGYSVKMQYSPDASGAYTQDCIPALVNFFGYSKGIHQTSRDYYTLVEFEDLVYDNLATSGPVIFSGYNSEAGHAFVADGYSTDGYFHINWGWSGMSNGYFLLNALDPDSQGIGGSAAGYNFGQSVILGIRPASEGDQKPEVEYLSNSPFEVLTPQVALGTNGKMKLGISTTDPQTAHFGVVLDIEGSDGKYYFSDDLYNMTLDPGYYYPAVDLDFRLPTTLPDGVYTVRPAVVMKDEDNLPTGVYIDIRFAVGLPSSATMKVEGGKATFDNEQSSLPVVTDGEFTTPLFVDRDFRFSGRIGVDDGRAYYGRARGILYIGSEAYALDEVMLDIDGPDNPFVYTSHIPANLLSGSWSFVLAIVDTRGIVTDYISDEYEVDVLPAPSGTVKIGCVLFDDLGSGTLENPIEVSANDIRAHIDVQCTEGTFYDSVSFWVLAPQGGNYWGGVKYVTSESLYLEAGESGSARFSFSFDEADEDITYAALPVDASGNWVDAAWAFFRVTHPAVGIEAPTIVTPDTDGDTLAEYYDLTGRRIARPASGLYLERRGSQTRLIRR